MGALLVCDLVLVAHHSRRISHASAPVRVAIGRPSPFERPATEIVKSEAPPPEIAQAVQQEPVPVQPAVHRESGFGRLISRIPLLRRLKKEHPQ